MIIVNVGGGVSSDDTLLFRALDLWPFGYGAANNFGFLVEPGTSRLATNALLYQGVLGAPATVWGDHGILNRHVGGAGEVGGQVVDLQVPLHHDPSVWPAPRKYLKYVCEYDTWRTANVAGPFCHGFTSQFSRLAPAINNIGFELKSESGVLGGSTVLFARLAQGAGVIQVLDTGVSPLGRTRWRWEFRDGPIKSLVLFANGVQVGAVSGQANFPAYAGYVTGERFTQPHWITGAGSAGTTDYVSRFLFEVRKNGGFN